MIGKLFKKKSEGENIENEVREYPIRMVSFSVSEIYASCIIVYEKENGSAQKYVLKTLCNNDEFPMVKFEDCIEGKIVFEYEDSFNDVFIVKEIVLPRRWSIVSPKEINI